MSNKTDFEKEITRSLRMGQAKSDIKEALVKLMEEEVNSGNTKYVFIMGIRENGSCFLRSHGDISELEANGMRVMIPEAMDYIIDIMYGDEEDEIGE